MFGNKVKCLLGDKLMASFGEKGFDFEADLMFWRAVMKFCRSNQIHCLMPNHIKGTGAEPKFVDVGSDPNVYVEQI